VHFGAGRAGVSTGAGPVGFYTSLGSGRSRSGSRGGKSRDSATASYHRKLARQQRQAEQTQRIEDAKELIKTFEHILSLHREEFPPATRPIAPPPGQPDRAAIYTFYKRQALQGVGMFKRAEGEQAKQKAAAWTDAEVQRLWNEQVQQHEQAQANLDQMWRQLCSNVPEVVVQTLQEAFEDNEAPSAALSVDGDEVSLALLVPDIDEVVPERWPTVTQVGNQTFRKLPKRERSDYYTIFVCAQVLVTVREAFAVAPGSQSGARHGAAARRSERLRRAIGHTLGSRAGPPARSGAAARARRDRRGIRRPGARETAPGQGFIGLSLLGIGLGNVVPMQASVKSSGGSGIAGPGGVAGVMS